jgi:hypothetical protein
MLNGVWFLCAQSAETLTGRPFHVDAVLFRSGKAERMACSATAGRNRRMVLQLQPCRHIRLKRTEGQSALRPALSNGLPSLKLLFKRSGFISQERINSTIYIRQSLTVYGHCYLQFLFRNAVIYKAQVPNVSAAGYRPTCRQPVQAGSQETMRQLTPLVDQCARTLRRIQRRINGIHDDFRGDIAFRYRQWVKKLDFLFCRW